MIVDAHCHISNETWNPQWWWDTLNTLRPLPLWAYPSAEA